MKVLAAFFMLISVCGAAVAQDYLPADDLVSEALDNHPLIKAADHRVMAAQRDAVGLRANPHEWNLSAGYTQRVIDNQFGFNEFDATLTRGIRRSGKAKVDAELGYLGEKRAYLASADTRHQVALDLARKWIDWLGREELAKLDNHQMQLVSKNLETVRRRYDNGDASQLDLELASSALADVQTRAVRSRGHANMARDALSVAFPEIVLPLNPPLLVAPELLSDRDVWIEKVINRSHEIELSRTEADLIGLAAKRSRLDERPDIEAGLRAFSERNGDEAGLGVVVNIPFGGSKRRAISERDLANASAAYSELALKRREVAQIASEDVRSLETAAGSWQLALQARDYSAQAIARMRRGYEFGNVDLSDLLAAEKRHLEAMTTEAIARAEAAYAHTRLRIDAHELWMVDADHPGRTD